MAETTEVPAERWREYLSRIEALQRDRPVRVEILGGEFGDQVLATHAQLRSISLSPPSEVEQEVELDLGVGDEIDHRVIHPQRLYVVQSSAGELECLDIEDGEHTKTIIFFEPTQAVDALSGSPPGL